MFMAIIQDAASREYDSQPTGKIHALFCCKALTQELGEIRWSAAATLLKF
jgi:hypothetical protein